MVDPNKATWKCSFSTMFLKFFIAFLQSIWSCILLVWVSSVHKYSTRGSSFNFAVPKSKGQARFTFYNTAIHHWNALPNEIKNTNDFNMFKQLVKSIWRVMVLMVSKLSLCSLSCSRWRFVPSGVLFVFIASPHPSLRTPIAISFL